MRGVALLCKKGAVCEDELVASCGMSHSTLGCALHVITSAVWHVQHAWLEKCKVPFRHCMQNHWKDDSLDAL